MKRLVLTTTKSEKEIKTIKNYCKKTNSQLVQVEELNKKTLKKNFSTVDDSILKYLVKHTKDDSTILIEGSTHLRVLSMDKDGLSDGPFIYTETDVIKRDLPILMGDYHEVEFTEEQLASFKNAPLAITHSTCPKTGDLLTHADTTDWSSIQHHNSKD